MANRFEGEGFQKLNAYLDKCIKAAEPENILAKQKEAAEHFTNIMHGLSAPRRKGNNGGQMLASITYQQDPAAVETEVGWGHDGWYGRLKESGHNAGGFGRVKAKKTHVKAQPHMRPTFEAHRDEILQIMSKDVNKGV